MSKAHIIDLTIDDDDPGLQLLTKREYNAQRIHGERKEINRDSRSVNAHRPFASRGPIPSTSQGISTFNPPPRTNVQVKKERVSNQSLKRPALSSSSPPPQKKRLKVEDPEIILVGDCDPEPSLPGPSLLKTRKGSAVPSPEDFIELDSEGEEVAAKWIEVPVGPPKKRTYMKFRVTSTQPSIISATRGHSPTAANEPHVEDEDYDNIHAGYDINNPKIWTAIPSNPQRMEREIRSPTPETKSDTEDPEDLNPPRSSKFRRPNISIPYPKHRPRSEGVFLWDMLRAAKNLRYPPNRTYACFTDVSGRRAHRPDLDVAVDLHKLKLTALIAECPGSITRVEQKNGWVAVGGACVGGGRDEADEAISPYNREGSLMAWSRHRQTILPGHRRVIGATDKHYGINDVKFSPCSMAFVSSAYDLTVQVWDCAFGAGFKLHQFKDAPHDLAFKSNSSVLAVGERRVHLFSDLSLRAQKVEFDVADRSSRKHVIGAVRWGLGPISDNLLFASTEPSDDRCFEGYHKGFDTEAKKRFCTFDASEAGDAMCIDPSGASLIITTRGKENKNILRLYDIRRRDGKAKVRLDLEPYPSGIEGEIHDAAFSSDGIYLALGRHDNETHVYDSRMFQRGPLFIYRHSGEHKINPGSKPCGVMKLQWLESRTNRLGLVTGGSDGCVRLWDPLRAAESSKNGTVLAEVNSDIASFSLGDRFKGEHQLIVGDCSGRVSIFDRFYDGSSDQRI